MQQPPQPLPAATSQLLESSYSQLFTGSFPMYFHFSKEQAGYHYYPFPCGHRLATFRNKVCINSSCSLSTPTCHSTQLGNSLG